MRYPAFSLPGHTPTRSQMLSPPRQGGELVLSTLAMLPSQTRLEQLTGGLSRSGLYYANCETQRGILIRDERPRWAEGASAAFDRSSASRRSVPEDYPPFLRFSYRDRLSPSVRDTELAGQQRRPSPHQRQHRHQRPSAAQHRLGARP